MVNTSHSQSKKLTVLIVDDVADNIDVLVAILKPKYKIKVAKNGLKALETAIKEPQPDLILLDVMMPQMDGYEVCTLIKNNHKTRSIPIIFVTAKMQIADELKGFGVGAIDYITKPFSPPIVIARVDTHITLNHQKKLIEQQVIQRTKELEASRLDFIQRLGRAAEYKDNETGMHVIRLSHYSKIIAQEISKDKTWVNNIFLASTLHDIGKIGLADSILLKDGKLTDKERKTMEAHCVIGAQIIGETTNELMVLAKEIVMSHHERWDGTGYPQRLKGEDIPLSARIVGLVDVFDALLSERPYKHPWSLQKAVSHILEQSGKHFDPDLVDIFIDKIDIIMDVNEEYTEFKVEEIEK